MTTTIHPFPISRRTRWVEKQRQRASTFPRRGEEWLRVKVQAHEDYLRAIGVDSKTIAREVRDLEALLFGTGNTDEKARA